MATCSRCGEEFDGRGLRWHEAKCSGSGAVAVAEKPAESKVSEAVPFQPRSKRGRRQYAADAPTALSQIRVNPHAGNMADSTGAWAYYLRPDGATIRDALVLYPNGGIPEIDDEKRRARFGTNASYYRERQRAKGFEYLGPVLTEAAVKRVVETVYANREDEILFCEDEIANCEYTISSSDVPDIRDQARKRRGQLERRLAILRQDVDSEKMAKELEEIARAQEMASLDPKLLRVMRQYVGEMTETMKAAIAKFSTGKAPEEGSGVRMRRPGDRDALGDSDGAVFSE